MHEWNVFFSFKPCIYFKLKIYNKFNIFLFKQTNDQIFICTYTYEYINFNLSINSLTPKLIKQKSWKNFFFFKDLLFFCLWIFLFFLFLSFKISYKKGHKEKMLKKLLFIHSVYKFIFYKILAFTLLKINFFFV